MDYKEKVIALLNDQELSKEQKEKLENIFPELAESKDERIRKELIELISCMHDADPRKKGWIAWLEKQGQKPKKVSIWKHWKDGIAGNGEGEQIYLIKAGNTYNLSSVLSFECDYIELSELDNLMLEKQDEKVTNINGEDYGIDGLYHAINILEKTVGKVAGYQSDDGILSHKAAINAVKELYKKQGMIEPKTLDVDKVIEWLRIELDKEEKRHYIHVHGFDKERREIFFEDFRKAMKGE